MQRRVGLFGARAQSQGLGRFAQEIAQALRDHLDFDVVLLDSEDAPEKLDSVVYASRTSARLKESAKLCAAHNIPLYVLSSDMNDDIAQIESVCTVVRIANSSLEVQEFLKDVTQFYNSHSDWKLAITEYHQEDKQDVSGTALALVRSLGLNENIITSIRDNNKTMDLFNIPDEHIHGYAIHQARFTSPKTHTSRTFEIIIVGRQTYVSGLIQALRS